GPLLFSRVREAARAREEGVLRATREGEGGALPGWGLPRWSGGPFSWLNIMGAPYAADRCAQLEEKCGGRFKCPPLLREMAEKGERFYIRFDPEAAQAA
ncbi:MAG: 3-hydroxyacyl-CoA dehydrogenase, partial [Ruegeria sp.]